MYLKKLHIKNFRCFSDYEIKFAPRVTVLFGKNGSGKTTLIHAMHKAMSMFMYSDVKTKDVIVNGKKKKKPVESWNVTSPIKELHPKGFSEEDCKDINKALIETEAWADMDEQCKDLHWNMSVYTNKYRLRTSEFIDAFREFYHWHKETGNLPLLNYISDSFPHKEKIKRGEKMSRIERERSFGYNDWDDEEVCMKAWIKRLERTMLEKYNIENLLPKLTDSETIAKKTLRLEEIVHELKTIEECLRLFCDSFSTSNENIYKIVSIVRDNNGDVAFLTDKGKEKTFANLPAGYKRIFSIVLDIAYRSFILSEKQSTDIEGLIMIDEIDLHLHPELEAEILDAFTKTFPKAQFIVSTHSPAVISNLRQDNDNRIVQMIHEGDIYGNVEMESIYGLDYNNTVSLVMGAQDRDPHVQTVKDRYVRLMRRGKTDKAALAAEEIKRLFPTKYESVIEELNAKIKES